MQGSILARLGNSHSENAPGETTGGSRAATGRHRWRWLAILLVLAALAAWGLRDRLRGFEFDWRAFLASFLALNWHWIVGAVALSLAAYFGRALRWAVMIRPVRREHGGIWSLFKSTAIGFAAVVLLGRPGEFVRPYLISVRERVSFSSQLAAWLLERIFDLLAILVLFGFAVTRIGHSHASPSGNTFRWVLQAGGWVATLLGLLCMAILIMFGKFSGHARQRLLDALMFLPSRHHQRADRFVTAFLEGTAATKTRGPATLLVLYTALEWAVIVLCFLFVFRAYPETAAFGLGDALIFLGLVSFGSVIQIPGIGGGIQLVSILALTEIFGVSLETATSLAIMLWIVTFGVIVPIGLAFAFHEGLNWRKIRELEKNAIRAGTGGDPDIATGESLP